MRTHTKETQDLLTPEHALEILKEGNERFVGNIKAHRNHLTQINETATGQFPFATILSCIDSRTSAELIFDQGLGDIFSIRIAGNILNEDILGSMEFACKVAGSKLIVVLGHTNCSAIASACKNFSLGHFTKLIDKIKPAIDEEVETTEDRNENNNVFTQNVATNNVHLTARQITAQSIILSEMKTAHQINIIGGLYNVENGQVIFYE